MSAVLDAALPIFALIGLGYAAARRRILGAGATTHLNDFVVWLALPALLFQSTAAITAAQIAHASFLLAFTGGCFATFAISFALERRRVPHALTDRSIEGLDAAYPNTGFMGIPLCLIAFGPAGLPPAIIASIITACVLFAAAIVLIEFDLSAEPRLGRTLGRVALALCRNPLVVAPAAGFAVAASGFALPGPVLRFTGLLGAAASPCALVTIGLFLAERSDGPAARGTVARLVALKLVAQPAITALLAFAVFSMPALWAREAVLLSALPTGTGPFMLAKLHDREAAVTSRTILVSTVLSVVTVSGLLAWFG